MINIFRISRLPVLCAALLGLGTMLGAPGAAAQSNRVEICHKGRTLTVSSRSIPGHQRHGDTVGECPNPLEEMRELTERLMLSCALNADTPIATHDVTGVSMSADITATLETVDFSLINCAEAQVVIAEAGCKEASQVGTPEAQTYLYACPSAADDALFVEDDG